LRPGRLEVQLRVELPDRLGRRDILRIHTRQMKETGALEQDAIDFIEDTTENGLAAQMEHYCTYNPDQCQSKISFTYLTFLLICSWS